MRKSRSLREICEWLMLKLWDKVWFRIAYNGKWSWKTSAPPQDTPNGVALNVRGDDR